MPRPAYRPLGEAIASVMDAAKITTVALAERLRERNYKVDQSRVSKWRNGHERPSNLDTYPTIEDICGVPKGTILRRAGYVEDRYDVVTAILAAPELTEGARRIVISVYDSSRSAPSATARETPAISSAKRSKQASR